MTLEIFLIVVPATTAIALHHRQQTGLQQIVQAAPAVLLQAAVALEAAVHHLEDFNLL